MTAEQFENLTAERLLQEVLIPRYGYAMDNAWVFAFYGDVGDWKIHVYADSPDDWASVAQVILPYLHLNRVFHKTFRDLAVLGAVTGSPTQKGKAFTIYCPGENVLKQVMCDLDWLLMEYGLERPDKPMIFGDRGVGVSGRIFYRYDKELSGSYRVNDGLYHPEGVEDPFVYLEVEAAIACLPVGKTLVFGREEVGSAVWPNSISGRHVSISRTDEGLMVDDMDSAHGTFVNGFRISQPTRVIPGDTLHLGTQVALFILQPTSRLG